MAATQEDNEKACLFSKTVIELIQIFSHIPINSECPLQAVLTWNKLGPFKFEQLVMDYPPKFKSFDIRVPVKRVDEFYMGQVQENGLKEGVGRILTETSIYEGEHVDLVPEGYGRQIYENGDWHIGFWKEGRPYGVGTRTNINDGSVDHRTDWNVKPKEVSSDEDDDGQIIS